MKKILFALVVITFPLSTYAQTCTHQNEACGNAVPDGCACDQSSNELVQAGTGTQTATTPDASSVSTAPVAPGGTFIPITNIPGITDTNTATESDLGKFLRNLYRLFIGAAAVIAVIQIIRAGIMIASKNTPAAHGEGRSLIFQSLLGLALVLLPVLVFSIINPAILNMSLNLDPVKTQAVAQPGTTLANGVQQSVTGTYLQTATFASTDTAKNDSEAAKWISQCKSGGGVGLLVQPSSCISGLKSTDGTLDCQKSSAAVASCQHFSPSKFTFSDTAFISVGAHAVAPITSDANSVLSFSTTCAKDGGYTCLANTGSAFTGPYQLPSCPSGVSGRCYQDNLACSQTKGDSSVCIGFYPTGAVDPTLSSKVMFYTGMYAYGLASDFTGQVVPADTANFADFQSKCAQHNSGVASVRTPDPLFNCPKEAGKITYDTAKYSGVKCYYVQLACKY